MLELFLRSTYLIIILIVLLSCSDSVQNNVDQIDISKDRINKNDSENRGIKINYEEFKPDSISGIKVDNFNINSSYIVNNVKVVTGSFTNQNIDFLSEEPLEDYGGVRLLFLDSVDRSLFKSRGGGDIYLFEPHFYRNKMNSKVVVICQTAFEYFCGGMAFLLEKNKIQEVGIIDVESNEMEISLINIVQIYEKDNQMIFEFNKDSLMINPGGQNERMIKNNNTRYIFENNQLKFEE